MLVLLASSGAWAGKKDRPSWVDGERVSRYPAGRYIVGIGTSPDTGDEAQDRARADNAARAEAAKQIRVQVKEAIVDIQREETGKAADFGSLMEIKSESSVDLSLEGLAIADRYFDPKKKLHHSLAVLERAKAAKRMSDKIIDLLKAADEVGRSARAYEGKFQMFLAVGNHLRCLDLFEEAYSHQLVLRAVGGQDDVESYFDEKPKVDVLKKDLKIEIERAKTAVQEIVASLSLEPLEGDNQKGEVGAPLADDLKARILYTKSGMRYPQRGFTVGFAFRQGQGKLIDRGQTDASGMAVSKVYEVTSGEAGAARVEAVLLADGIVEGGEPEPSVRTAFERKRANFTINLPEKRFAVKVFENCLDREIENSQVEAEIVTGLVNRGYPVVEPRAVLAKVSESTLRSANTRAIVDALRPIAEVVIVGEVSARESSKMGQITFARARGTVKVLRTDNGKVLASADMEVKDGGNDADNAGRRAINRLASQLAGKILSDLDTNME